MRFSDTDLEGDDTKAFPNKSMPLDSACQKNQTTWERGKVNKFNFVSLGNKLNTFLWIVYQFFLLILFVSNLIAFSGV